jgi:hypothetical protein
VLWSFVPVAFLLPPTRAREWPSPFATRSAPSEAPASRRVEQATGVVLIALAGRLALDSR